MGRRGRGKRNLGRVRGVGGIHEETDGVVEEVEAAGYVSGSLSPSRSRTKRAVSCCHHGTRYPIPLSAAIEIGGRLSNLTATFHFPCLRPPSLHSPCSRISSPARTMPSTDSVPTGASAAVLKPSEPMPEFAETVEGPNFEEEISLQKLLASYQRIGFQANSLGKAIDIVNKMVRIYYLSSVPDYGLKIRLAQMATVGRAAHRRRVRGLPQAGGPGTDEMQRLPRLYLQPHLIRVA